MLVTIVSKDKSSLVLWKSASHKCVNWINGMAPIFKSTSVGFEASLKQEKKEKKNKSDTFHSNNKKMGPESRLLLFISMIIFASKLQSNIKKSVKLELGFG